MIWSEPRLEPPMRKPLGPALPLTRGKVPRPTSTCPPRAQKKLRSQSARDPFEREADEVSTRMAQLPDPGQALSNHDVPGHLERHLTNSGSSPNGGAALRPADRRFFEPLFDRDLGAVRIHTDQEAADSARSLQARAFTIQRDIFFGGGAYEPGTQRHRHLLAHELTHVLQQYHTGPRLQRAPTPNPAEVEGEELPPEPAPLEHTLLAKVTKETGDTPEKVYRRAIEINLSRTNGRTPDEGDVDLLLGALKDSVNLEEVHFTGPEGRAVPLKGIPSGTEIHVTLSPEWREILDNARAEMNEGRSADRLLPGFVEGKGSFDIKWSKPALHSLEVLAAGFKVVDWAQTATGVGALGKAAVVAGVRATTRSQVKTVTKAVTGTSKAATKKAPVTPAGSSQKGKQLIDPRRAKSRRSEYENFVAPVPALAKNRAEVLSQQTGVPIPADRILAAPWQGGARKATRSWLGFRRDARAFWEAFEKAHPSDFQLIGYGRTLTKELAKKWGWWTPGFAKRMGFKTLKDMETAMARVRSSKKARDLFRFEHHHINFGEFCFPLPRGLHGKEVHKTLNEAQL